MRRQPFILAPAAQNYLWGGTRLNDDYNFGMPVSPFAEAWVCSTHSDGESFVPSLNCSLSVLLKKYPSWIGTHVLQITGGKPELPILIKLIDAKRNLSVQVHPDDEYAWKMEGQRGKTEMWYVLDAIPGSFLTYGFNQTMDKEKVRSVLEKGEIEKYLNHVPVHRDDLFYIEAGMVHAIGAGALIAEIQESSNITYRLYDYGRLDKNGKARPLHIDRALEVMNMDASNSPRQPMRVLKYRSGCASELLTRCKYFQVERMLLNTEVLRELVDYQTGANSFHALLCVGGCGSITGDGFMLNFFKGDCVFVPADSVPFKLHGQAQFLDVSC